MPDSRPIRPGKQRNYAVMSDRYPEGQREAHRIQDAVMPGACPSFAVYRFGHPIPQAAHPAAIVAEKVYASAATGSKQEFFRHSKVTKNIAPGLCLQAASATPSAGK
jgi:hypothetical protein